MKTLKTLKVFIFEPNAQDGLKIKTEIKELLESLKIESQFCLCNKYELAKKKIQEERFDIFSLADLLDIVEWIEARRFLAIVTALNPKSIPFFLFDEPNFSSFKLARENDVFLSFAKGKNFGEVENIFHPSDIVDVKKMVIRFGLTNFQVNYSDLGSPVCVFSQTYNRDNPSEKMAQESCAAIAEILNAYEIQHYSGNDFGNFRWEIFVGEKDITETIKNALKSSLDFWYFWIKTNLK